MKKMSDVSYVPDHIRIKRTDRLVHYRDSMELVFKRYLPTATINWEAYNLCSQYRAEIGLIDVELHKRLMRHDKASRARYNPRYRTDHK